MNRFRKFLRSQEGYLYIFPALLIIFLFNIYPIAYTFYVSLHRWRIRKGDFIGLTNYQNLFGPGPGLILLILTVLAFVLMLFFRDNAMNRLRRSAKLMPGSRISRMTKQEQFFYFLQWIFGISGLILLVYALSHLYSNGDNRMFDSLRITIWYSVGAVPVQLAGGIFIAWFLNNKFKGRQFFRVIYLLPYIVPTVAAAAVFERLFSLRPESFANQIMISMDLPPQEWLRQAKGIFSMLFGWGQGENEGPLLSYLNTWAQGPSMALVSILFFNWWVFTGYYALIYANGLAQVPKELYEAAEVDGASRWTVFKDLTIPLISPTTYFLTLLGIIGTFKSFSHVWVLRSDFTRGAADPVSIYIFNVFYNRSQFGYASALSLFLMAIVLLLTLAQQRMMKNRVHYGD